MRKLFTILMLTMPVLAYILAFNTANAQARFAPLTEQDFNLSVQNMTQTAPNKLEWDTYLLDTDPTQPFELASVQFGFFFNSTINNGGTITVAINNTGSGLIPAQQFSAVPSVVATVTGYPGLSLLRLAGKIPPGAGNGTIISTTGLGTLLTHMIMTNTVPFTTGSTPNFAWTSSSAITPVYATRVAEYISMLNTQLTVTPGSNALICGLCNPVLNPDNNTSTADAGPDQVVYAGQDVQLAGVISGCATGGIWSGGAGTFNPNANTLNAVYTPTASEVALGTVTLTLTTTGSGPCILASDAMTVTFNPSGFTLSVLNLTQPTDRTIEFDVYMLDTDLAQTFELATVQFGFMLNSLIYIGGSLSGTIDNTGSGLLASQQFTAAVSIVSSLSGYPDQTLIRLACNAPPGAGNGTIISSTGQGTLLTHFKITSTVAWTNNSLANLTFNSNTVSVPLYGTKVARYVSGINTQLAVSPGVNALVCCNPVLNPGTNLPIAYPVTGGGSYCFGMSGMPVILSNSEIGVTYTLYKNNVAQTPVYPGTGGAIVFSNQTAGTYTVWGTNSFGTTQMTGSAIVTEAASMTLMPAITNETCGLSNGAIDLSVSGGVPAYTYLWSNGLTTEDISGLSAGVYTVTVIDALGCGASMSANITNSVPLSAGVSITASANNILAGTSVTFTATPYNGGTPSYQWFVNSLPVGTGLITYTYNPANGDNVYVVMNSSISCIVNNPATSNVIHMNVSTANVSDFMLTVQNLTQPTDRTIEFDVYLLDTYPADVFELAYIQFGFLLNSDIYTGGTLTAAYDNTGSGLIPQQQFTAGPNLVSAIAGYPGQTLIRQPGKVPPGAGNGTIISTTGLGTLITHYTLTSTVSWTTNSMLNMTFVSNSSVTPLYATRVAEYIGGGNTQLTVTPGTNALVCCYLLLNAAASNPVVSTWTGFLNNEWYTASNWNNGVPGIITEVIIPGGLLNYPTLTEPAVCAGITIEDGGSFIGAEYLNTGTALVRRNIPNTKAHFLSSPVSNAKFGIVFSNSMNTWARSYNPLSGLWEYKNALNPFGVGTGYNVSTTNVSGVAASFAGPLNKVAVVSTLSNANGGWNLLGNPFQSAISWNAIIPLLGSGVSSVVKVWNGTTYLDWNGSVGSLPGGIIPAENGFFVSTLTNASTLTIPLAARVHSTVPFYKESVSRVLRINAEGNDLEDATFVHFNNDATSGYDNQFDGVKLMSEDISCPQIYTFTADKHLSINELPLAGNETVKLGFICRTDGSYSLRASGIESFDADTPILLEDIKLNKLQDLRQQEVYSFNYSTADDAGRFKLHFKTISNFPDAGNHGISIFSYDHKVIINNTTGLAGEVSIYDMTGRELIHSAMSSRNTTSIPVQAAIGGYLVKVVTANAIVNNKVFIQ